jgi:hypothetical protein
MGQKPEPIACDKMVTERKRNMYIFQVTSRTIQSPGVPTRRARPASWWRDFLLRLLVAGLIIVVPPSLPLVLLVIAGTLVTSIAIMVRVVSSPALDRALRLDES